MNVRNKACDLLLAHRINIKTQTNKINGVSHRLFIAMPQKRDNVERPPFIPPSVLAARTASGMDVEKKTTEKDLEEEHGGHGVYNLDMRKFWDLKNSNEKYDAIPEIWEGKNIADYVDSDILAKLEQLEAEESEIQKAIEEARGDMDMEDGALSEGEELLYDEIQYQREKVTKNHMFAVARNHAVRPRKIRESTLGGMADHLEDLGYDLTTFTARAEKVRDETRAKDQEREEVRRGREKVRMDERMAEDDAIAEKLTRAMSRSKSRIPKKPAPGLKSIAQTMKSKNMLHYTLKKLAKKGRQGTADRFIGNLRPKHLLTGKRGIGKTDRR